MWWLMWWRVGRGLFGWVIIFSLSMTSCFGCWRYSTDRSSVNVYEKLGHWSVPNASTNVCVSWGVFSHGNYGKRVDSARKVAQAIQLASHGRRPRPEADGVVAICWLTDKVVTDVWRRCLVSAFPSRGEAASRLLMQGGLTVVSCQAVTVGRQSCNGQSCHLGDGCSHHRQVACEGHHGEGAP